METHPLLKSDGTPVELPFLEIDQELWDADSGGSPCCSTPAASSVA